jgi:hypothetical protein
MPIDATDPLAAVALAVTTVLSLAVLVVAGWLTERLLGGFAREWARRSRE